MRVVDALLITVKLKKIRKTEVFFETIVVVTKSISTTVSRDITRFIAFGPDGLRADRSLQFHFTAHRRF